MLSNQPQVTGLVSAAWGPGWSARPADLVQGRLSQCDALEAPNIYATLPKAEKEMVEVFEGLLKIFLLVGWEGP